MTGAGHFSRIGEIARNIQVANTQDWLAEPNLDLRKLTSETRADEACIMAGPSVVERTNADGGDAMLGAGLVDDQAEEAHLGHLAEPRE
jgi:hypothetical protein